VILFICLVLELLAGMEVDLFVPSFPLIQECFSLSPFLLELMLGLNLTSYCVASFIVSPLSEYLGKKNTVMLGCLIFVLGSVLCSMAPTYMWILAGRFLQGLGIALPCVLAYVIITDHYSEQQQMRFIGYMNATITFGMAIAPVIGSYVAHKFGWCGNFHTLTLFGILTFFMVLLFLPYDKPQKKYEPFIKSFKPVLTNRVGWLMMATIVMMFQGYWVFIALSPLLFIEVYKVDLIHFGYYQGSLSFVFAIGSIFGGRLIEWMGEIKAIKYSSTLLFVSGILIALCICFNAPPLFITISLCIHTLGTVLPIIFLWPMFINMDKNHKTQRSSVITALRLISTAVIIQFISYLYDNTFFYIGGFIAAVSFIAYPLLMASYKKRIAL
jgi:DHA1 family bicyclomycin/chloramphenicol resistance-like MFS transporter